MLLILFVILLATCLALWSLGAPAWLVFLLALAAWSAFYVLAYPKVRTYKRAMGIDDTLIATEAKGWQWLGLHLAGLKVLVLGFLTSMVPFVGELATLLGGQNFSIFFGPDSAAKITFYIGAVVFALPFLTSWLHVSAIRDAAETVPQQTVPPQSTRA